MKRYFSLALVLAITAGVAPISAQELPRSIELAPAEVTVNNNVPVPEVTIIVEGCDSLCRDERAAQQEQLIATILANQAPPAPQSVWSKGFQTAIVGILLWAVYEYRQKEDVADNTTLNGGDQTVTNEAPETHTHDKSGKSHR